VLVVGVPPPAGTFVVVVVVLEVVVPPDDVVVVVSFVVVVDPSALVLVPVAVEVVFVVSAEEHGKHIKTPFTVPGQVPDLQGVGASGVALPKDVGEPVQKLPVFSHVPQIDATPPTLQLFAAVTTVSSHEPLPHTIAGDAVAGTLPLTCWPATQFAVHVPLYIAYPLLHTHVVPSQVAFDPQDCVPHTPSANIIKPPLQVGFKMQY
jgi:hypothetical protein